MWILSFVSVKDCGLCLLLQSGSLAIMLPDGGASISVNVSSGGSLWFGTQNR